MKHHIPKLLLSAAVAAAMVVGVTACTSDTDEGSVAAKDSLIIVQQADVASLSTNIAAQRTASRIAGEITEAATRISFESGEMTIEPALAESWNQLDAHTWEFKVRSGVEFTNGAKLTAEDFKRSLDLYRENPAGKVTTIMNNIEIDVIDDSTFNVITAEENLGSLPIQLTWMAILPADYRAGMTEAEFGDSPIGTGPYMLKAWQKGISIELEANENYWRGAPEIKTVTIQFVSDAATRVGMLETGAADIAADLTPAVAPRAEAIPGTVFKWGDSDIRSMLVLNSNTPPTDDLLVRRAISHAIDKEALVDTLFSGHAGALEGVLIANELGYDPDFKGYEYDPDKARELLAEAGYPDGNIPIDFNYTIGTNLQDDKVAEALQAMFEAVGFDVSMKGGEFATMQPTWREPGASSGIYQMTYGPVYPDTSFQFNKAYFHPGAVYGPIWTKKDDVLTKIADEALTTADPKDRQKLYEEANARVIDQALWVPLFTFQNGYAMIDSLNWSPVIDNRFYFENASFK